MKNLILALFLSVALIACDGNEEGTEEGMDSTPQQEETQTGGEESTEESSEETDSVIDNIEQEEAKEAVSDKLDEDKEDTVQGTTNKTGSWTGKVVSLADFVRGDVKPLDLQKVKQLVDNGQYVGFVSNGTFYMLYNAGSASYNWKELAKAAGNENVEITGQVRSVGGISIIMAEDITL